MSGVSEARECIRCGGPQMECSIDPKHEDYSGACLDCGFSFNTVHDQMTLEEVNVARAEYGMELLSELTKQS